MRSQLGASSRYGGIRTSQAEGKGQHHAFAMSDYQIYVLMFKVFYLISLFDPILFNTWCCFTDTLKGSYIVCTVFFISTQVICCHNFACSLIIYIKLFWHGYYVVWHGLNVPNLTNSKFWSCTSSGVHILVFHYLGSFGELLDSSATPQEGFLGVSFLFWYGTGCINWIVL